MKTNAGKRLISVSGAIATAALIGTASCGITTEATAASARVLCQPTAASVAGMPAWGWK